MFCFWGGMGFDQDKFNQFIIENRVIGFPAVPITLASGRQSNWYVNWRTISEDVFLTDRLTDYLIKFIGHLGLKPDTLYGVPEGATKIALDAQKKLAKSSPNYGPHSHILSMGREKPKEHGQPRDRYFLGKPRGDTIIIEDVTTTGGSLERTIDQLQEVGVTIIAAVGLTNRMECNSQGISVREAIERKNVRYEAMSHATELLPLAYHKLRPGKDIPEAIEREFAEYGVHPLRLSD